LPPHVDLNKHIDPLISLQMIEDKRDETTSLTSNRDEDITDSIETVKDSMASFEEMSSSHTFILYLTDCERGGETNLLRRVPKLLKPSQQSASVSGDAYEAKEILASVKPKRGRLFVFPHLCPHEGAVVIDVPKLLLRGEMI
jgi:hypothetical protein